MGLCNALPPIALSWCQPNADAHVPARRRRPPTTSTATIATGTARRAAAGPLPMLQRATRGRGARGMLAACRHCSRRRCVRVRVLRLWQLSGIHGMGWVEATLAECAHGGGGSVWPHPLLSPQIVEANQSMCGMQPGAELEANVDKPSSVPAAAHACMHAYAPARIVRRPFGGAQFGQPEA